MINLSSFLSKRRLIVVSGVLIGIILITLVIFLLGDKYSKSPESPTPSSSGLPLVTPLNSPFVSAQPSSQPPSASNLALTIAYTRGDQFKLAIQDIKTTAIKSTIEKYAPSPGNPYALLRLVSKDSRIIKEYKISVATEVILEGPATIYPLPESTSYLVIDAQALTNATSVQILTSTGRLLDEKVLPEIKAFSWKNRLYSLFDQMTAWAQTNSTLNIVIINERGNSQSVNSGLRAAENSTRQMIESLAPWTNYAKRINVITLVNSDQDLGCFNINFGGSVYPVCPNEGRIASIVEAGLAERNIYDWETTIVVNPDSTCGCGIVATSSSPVAAVAVNSTSQLIAHELGHSMGHMIDEYFYQPNFSNLPARPLGINCFESQSDCQEATANLPGSECSLGCSSTLSWRPSTRIMHNTYTPFEYGPFEECLMHEAIASALGEFFTCQQSQPSPNTSTPTPIASYYWGWHR